ncbi:MAG: trypsin-like peptidase domain-containing protein [Firmicutes bacterium]|nr:trypsin-like peptidase domain-containing protein [Bacillota bacterium]
MDDWDKFQYDDNKTVYTDTAEAPKRAPKEKKEPVYVTRKAFAVTLIICMVISAAVGAGAYALAMSHFGGAVIDKTVTTTNYNLASATGSELSVQEIIARNENSVVAISTESISTDTWLRQYITQGAGSGVIYSKDGYIITNNHVIEGASTIKVTLYDGSSYDATLVASDEQTDLAVIKIDKTDLTPVATGNMGGLSVGDLVVAIGNPLGTLSGTATEGIISALEREITLDGKTMTLIQTSASINPGNSGGGLFDQHGNLIGIVVAKSSGSDVEGLGFAIPCDKVSNVVKSLIENGYVEGRPAAGITIVDLTSAQKAMQYGVSITGVYIQEVTGENAKKAGLKAGDLIYYLDDVKITDSAILLKTIQSHQVGDTVEFTVVRDNEMKKIKVQLQDAQEAAGSSN